LGHSGMIVPQTVSIASATFGPIASQTWTGGVITPEPLVKMGPTTLVLGTDYMLTYADNVQAGTATVTATGIGSYGGAASETFEIAPAAISSASVSVIADQAYTGSAIAPKPLVKMGTTTLVEGADYALSYTGNTAVGTAAVTIAGMGNFAGTASATFRIAPAAISGAAVAPIADQAWTGNAITPSPAIVFAGKTLVLGTDYALSYTGNTAVGTATVTITGIGNFAGTVSTSFRIAGSGQGAPGPGAASGGASPRTGNALPRTGDARPPAAAVLALLLAGGACLPIARRRRRRR